MPTDAGIEPRTVATGALANKETVTAKEELTAKKRKYRQTAADMVRKTAADMVRFPESIWVLPACYSRYVTAWFSLFTNWLLLVLPAAFNFR